MNSVSIVVPTLNRADSLRATLAQLVRCRSEGLAVRIDVVDNGSTDNTSAVIAEVSALHPHVHRHVCRERGKSRALNFATRRIEADIFAFTDDDVLVPADWILRLTRPLRADEADAVGGMIKLHPDCVSEWMRDWHYIALADTRFVDDSDYDLVGANMAVRARALKTVGGFNDALGPGSAAGLGEDSFLSMELKRRGFRVLFDRACEVTHHPDMSRFDAVGMLNRASAMGRSVAHLNRYYGRDKHTFVRLRRFKLQIRKLLMDAKFRLAGQQPCHDTDYLAIVSGSAYYTELLQLRASTERRP